MPHPVPEVPVLSHLARPADRRLWGVFVALSSIWGSSFLFIKIGLEDGLPPLSLVTWRLAFATATLVVLLRLSGGRFPRDRTMLARIALLGATNVTVPFVLITWGELSIPSAVASILNGLVPLFTIVFAAAVLRDEPMTVSRLGGLGVGFAGAVLILSRGLAAPAPAIAGGPPLAGELEWAAHADEAGRLGSPTPLVPRLEVEAVPAAGEGS